MLSNYKVIDLSGTLPGPYCTQLLAYFGAEVIKVERPIIGDSMRDLEPWIFDNINKGKKSIVLDLKAPEDRLAFYELIKDADVVVEGFRPGVVERLGVDYETVKLHNPSIIYCSITGYGQTGPYKDFPGHDLNFMALSGALTMTGNVEEDPVDGHIQKIPISDFAAGLFAANAITAALSSKKERKESIYIDISMMDIMVTWAALKSPYFFTQKDKQEPVHEAHYGLFKTKDDKFIALGVIEDHFWVKLCEYLEWYDLLVDPALKTYEGRNKSSPKIVKRLRTEFSKWTQSDIVEELVNLGIPCSPVNQLAEVCRDPHVLERKLIHNQDEKIHLSIPIKFSGYSPKELEDAPLLNSNAKEMMNRN